MAYKRCNLFQGILKFGFHKTVLIYYTQVTSVEPRTYLV